MRRVQSNGIIEIIAGSLGAGWPSFQDGSWAQSYAAFGPVLFVDSSDTVVLGAENVHGVCRIRSNGYLQLVPGTVPSFVPEAIMAPDLVLSTSSISGDPSTGDLYVADPLLNRIRRLVLHTPVRLQIAGGDRQVVKFSQALTNPLQLLVVGRAGAGVIGVQVRFAVEEGFGAVNAASVLTDETGGWRTRSEMPAR